jgi:DNA segregation ATPase FtsK/SpoIIIE, S-DNA-T family
MDEHIADKIYKLLQQIDSRLTKVEEKLDQHNTIEPMFNDDPDPLLAPAVDLILQYDKASPSLIQRYLQIGYARAARILDQLEKAGIIGIAVGAKPRRIFIDKALEYLEKQNQASNHDEVK